MFEAAASGDALQSLPRSLRRSALATIFGAAALGATASATDQLVAINFLPPRTLTRLRTPADRWLDTGIVEMNVAPSGLTYDGTHLYWFIAENGLSVLRRRDPVGGQQVSVGPSGAWGSLAPVLENHPQSGVLYALAGGALYTIDKSTAAATLVAALSGPAPARVRSFAIDSTGRAIAMSESSSLFQIDLATGALTPLGDLGLPSSINFDLAFDSQDQLWALRNMNALYSIDVSSVAATLQSTANVISMASLAVVPGGVIADWSFYCYGAPMPPACALIPWASNVPASISAAGGFELFMQAPSAGSPALLVYGLSGRAAVPFHGGTLCIAAPVRRALVQSAAATPGLGCNGMLSVDFGAYAAGALGGSPHPALQVAGTVVDAQWIVRDPSASTGSTVLTGAGIEFTMNP